MLNDYSTTAGTPRLFKNSKGVTFAQAQEDIALAQVLGTIGKDKSKAIFNR